MEGMDWVRGQGTDVDDPPPRLDQRVGGAKVCGRSAREAAKKEMEGE